MRVGLTLHTTHGMGMGANRSRVLEEVGEGKSVEAHAHRGTEAIRQILSYD